MHQLILDTPLGWFRMLGTAKHITSAHWISEEDAIVGSPGEELEWKMDAERQVNEYFQGQRDSFSLPLMQEGTEFQKAVWSQLCLLPKGSTSTYGTIARNLGKPDAAQSVGNAIGNNPLLLLVPCHRVIGGDGSLTGYAGGLEAKEWLLEHEGALAAPQLRLF